MYSIQKNEWGYKLTFDGFISADEMKKWLDESNGLLASQSSGFGVFVDMRTMKTLAPDAQEILQEGQKGYKGKGMTRSCVILSDAIATMQLKRIAQETGIYEWERYIDASAGDDWEAKGINWIKDGTDPD